MKLFLSVRIILLVILIIIGLTKLYSFNSYISTCLGFLTYLVAYIASYLINYYPDPVSNKTLNSYQLTKLISRKFYRAMGIKYLIVFAGIYVLVTNGFLSLGVLLGVAISVVSISILISFYK